MSYIPFTYVIGWSKINKYYYGARYAKGSHPNQLWTTYFTSSKYIADYRQKYGEPDIIQIRKIFKSRDITISWEHRVLKRLHVATSDKWINKSTGGLVTDNDTYKKAIASRTGFRHSQKSKDQMSLKRKGIPKSPEFKKHLSTKFKGRQLTTQWKQNISNGRQNLSDEIRQKYSISNRKTNLGRKKSKETKDKHAKTYEFISSNNEIIKIHNLKQYCIDNNLNCSCMRQVYSGKVKIHKGYQAFKIPNE